MGGKNCILFRSVACSPGGVHTCYCKTNNRILSLICANSCRLKKSDKVSTNLSLPRVSNLLLLHDTDIYKVYRVKCNGEKKKKQRGNNLHVLNYFAILCWATFTVILGYTQTVVEQAYNYTKRNSPETAPNKGSHFQNQF